MDTSYPLAEKWTPDRIKSIGVELEGGWDVEPDFVVHGDGSVSCPGEFTGESHTEPKTKMSDVFKEIDLKYPDHVNGSCGMHVHFALSDLDYALLCSNNFWDYHLQEFGKYVDYMIKSFPVNGALLLPRWKSEISYCKKIFRPEKQIYDKDKSSARYAQWNFCHALHGTVECRLLPMFTKRFLAKMGVAELARIVDSFLVGNMSKEKMLYWSVIGEPETDDGIVKEEILCV